MKRQEKTQKIHGKRHDIDNRLFYLAWNNNFCCHLKSVGRKDRPKVGFKPF